MSATKITFAALTVSLLAARPAAAEPMTLAKCIDVALHGNPDITSANLEVEATTAQTKSARGAFGPRLHLDAGIQRWDSPLTASFADMLVPFVNEALPKNPAHSETRSNSHRPPSSTRTFSQSYSARKPPGPRPSPLPSRLPRCGRSMKAMPCARWAWTWPGCSARPPAATSPSR